MKKYDFSGVGFFGKLFLGVLVIEAIAIWLSLIAIPGILIFLTGNALWALLYIITFPMFLFIAAYLEMQARNKRK